MSAQSTARSRPAQGKALEVRAALSTFYFVDGCGIMQCYAVLSPTPDMLGPDAVLYTAGSLLPDQLLLSSLQLANQFIFLCFQLAALELG